MPAPQRIDLHELRHSWYAVLTGITYGQVYLITRRGVPFAQLQPFELQDQTLEPNMPYDDAISTTMQRLTTHLTDETLAKLMGISEVLFKTGLRTGYLPQDALVRLDALDDLVKVIELQGHLSPLLWMTLPRGALKQRSPLQSLQLPWTPDSPNFLAIRRLAVVSTTPDHPEEE